MAQVSGSIHETQCGPCEESLQGVILDQYCVTAHSEGLTEESHSVFGVVKDIDEHDCVKAGVSERDMPTIKGHHGDTGFVPNQDVDPLNREIRPKAHDEIGDSPSPQPMSRTRASRGIKFAKWELSTRARRSAT